MFQLLTRFAIRFTFVPKIFIQISKTKIKMKTQLQKMSLTFILLLCGMFSPSFSIAQTCPNGKVWACRYDACGVQECKCIHANQVQNWMAATPPCNGNNGNCCPGPHGNWRLGDNESLETSLRGIFPNPVYNLATISFSLNQSQKVSLNIFDMSGRVVTILADASFEQGDYEMEWNVSNMNAGIYFLRFEAGNYLQTEKVSIIK